MAVVIVGVVGIVVVVIVELVAATILKRHTFHSCRLTFHLLLVLSISLFCLTHFRQDQSVLQRWIFQELP